MIVSGSCRDCLGNGDAAPAATGAGRVGGGRRNLRVQAEGLI